MTEPRYIDADKITKRLPAVGLDGGDSLVSVADVRRIIAFAAAETSADVVEVVRCKDCKHWEHEDDVDFVCNRHYGYRLSTDFCSQGERREDDDG